MLLGTFSRSFLLTFEECLVDELFRFGPVIAAGAPWPVADEPVLGATRLRLGEDWKQRVQEIVSDAGLVVLMLDNTPGAIWELEQALDSSKLSSYFLLMPPLLSASDRQACTSSYAALRDRFPVLPEYDPRIVGFSFESIDIGPRLLLSPAPFPSSAMRVSMLGAALDEWFNTSGCHDFQGHADA